MNTNDIVIKFLDTFYKNKPYDSYKSKYYKYTCIIYEINGYRLFGYDIIKDKYYTSTILDNEIKKYIPDYNPYDDSIEELIDKWIRENVIK